MPVIQGHDIDADLAVGLSEMSHHSAVHSAAMARLDRDRVRLGLPPMRCGQVPLAKLAERSWALPVILLAASVAAMLGLALWVLL